MRKLFLRVICLSLVIITNVLAEQKPAAPPKKAPAEGDTLQTVDGVSLKVELYLWQNFMPGPQTSGPPFYVSLQLEVKNNSNKKLVGFKPKIITLYTENTKTPLHTFKLVSDDPKAPTVVNPQETEYFTYTNDRSETFSPKLEKGSKFYGRILLVWNGRERIISTPPVAVEFTY
ncbi:MAG: hypothetical protein A2Z27_03085 [candidate division Zixibacteria bacterium RBG_16_50_21]|nr:MAG: hypothetical protein A2Z27_03085 [candidate division Zixibacteria bacterium RBG_16_50_21]